MKKKVEKNILYILIAGSIISSCVTSKNYKYLSFVFDGVPEPEAKSMKNDSLIDSTALIATMDTVIIKSLVNKHVPFAKNECYKCHSEENVGGYSKPQPQMCYQCHEDFNDKYNVIHGPAAGGYCTSCHNPHKTKQKFLLAKSEDQLCFTCHDSKIIYQNKFHEEGETNCTKCHNPHGGPSRYLISGFACSECHEDYTNKYKFTHGPVNGGHCLACHDSHNSKKKKHLLREGNSTCLDCHNRALVYSSLSHNDENKACTDCHNPHGGTNRYFTSLN